MTNAPAPTEWRGRFFEDLEPGLVFTSRLGRTVTETDNVWFTCLTMNTNQLHFNDHYAEQSAFGRPLVNSCLTVALVTGLSVPDTSENAVANLAWTDIHLPAPVYVGDTLWAQTEILGARASDSRPDAGIVDVRTRGINQREEVVIEFKRTFMIHRRSAPGATGAPVRTSEEWRVA
ncbi:MAG: MaoC family dehydratase [Solirubrobacteraceae bacterium]